MGDTSTGKSGSDPQQEEVQRFAWAYGTACPVLRIQLAQDVEDWIELRAQLIHPAGGRRRRLFSEQRTNHFSGLCRSSHDRERLDGGFRAEETGERLKLRRCLVSPLGAGGMGEVYRARDTKLDRDVALKILPESFANDPDRLMRFEREAKALASLNHPNIAAIYGIEESGAQGPGPGSGDQCTRALVMELVEGEDLSGRIGRGAMSLGDALALARQIADALAAAHEKGIVHRDLKPANVMVTRGGGE